MVLECCCHADALCLCRAALLFFGVGVAEQAHFDLYMTSAPVGHHVPRQPLVTGSHLHPSPASSPPSSSSPSTLPSSSQSSVTGPPRFSFSYSLFPHDFFLSQGESAFCKCFHFILSLWVDSLCILVWSVCSECCPSPYLFTTSPSIPVFFKTEQNSNQSVFIFPKHQFNPFMGKHCLPKDGKCLNKYLKRYLLTDSIQTSIKWAGNELF